MLIRIGKEILTFDAWMKRVDEACWKHAGLSIHDLPDVPLADWFSDHVLPSVAAAKAIKSAREDS